MDFRAKSVFKAKDGEKGEKNNRTGASASDLYLEVPIGTLVKVVDRVHKREDLVADLTDVDEKLLIATGGAGGKGNFRFKSSTNQIPLQFTPGEKGEEKDLILEIKLIADVGLIGLPNAGKSTLLNSLTHASAKVGNYPFTTIEPNLGVMDVSSLGVSYALADLPGLIEGAASGKGLGDEFLRHVERTRFLVHMIDPFLADAVKSYKAIRKELEAYSKELSEKKEIVVINKIDLSEVKDEIPEIKKDFKKFKVDVLFVSAATGEGIEALKKKISEVMQTIPKPEKYKASLSKTYTLATLPKCKF